MTIAVTLNGQPAELPDGATVTDALAKLGVAPDQPGVAVAVGLEIIRRTDWPTTPLTKGAEVEVVTAAQGG